jgi:hypothetical protein
MDGNTQRERYFITHNNLIGAADYFAQQITVKDEISFNAMGCTLFCALALEASINYIGSMKFSIWNEHLEKKLSPKGKLELIASHAQFKVNYGQKPFQSFSTLFKLRDQLAHGKMQILEYKDDRQPLAVLETFCTGERAKSFLEDTKQMVTILHDISGVQAIPLFILALG